MALPLKYNIRNIVVRKGSTLATAFTIGLTVAILFFIKIKKDEGFHSPQKRVYC